MALAGVVDLGREGWTRIQVVNEAKCRYCTVQPNLMSGVVVLPASIGTTSSTKTAVMGFAMFGIDLQFS